MWFQLCLEPSWSRLWRSSARMLMMRSAMPLTSCGGAQGGCPQVARACKVVGGHRGNSKGRLPPAGTRMRMARPKRMHAPCAPHARPMPHRKPLGLELRVLQDRRHHQSAMQRRVGVHRARDGLCDLGGGGRRPAGRCARKQGFGPPDLVPRSPALWEGRRRRPRVRGWAGVSLACAPPPAPHPPPHPRAFIWLSTRAASSLLSHRMLNAPMRWPYMPRFLA